MAKIQVSMSGLDLSFMQDKPKPTKRETAGETAARIMNEPFDKKAKERK